MAYVSGHERPKTTRSFSASYSGLAALRLAKISVMVAEILLPVPFILAYESHHVTVILQLVYHLRVYVHSKQACRSPLQWIFGSILSPERYKNSSNYAFFHNIIHAQASSPSSSVVI